MAGLAVTNSAAKARQLQDEEATHARRASKLMGMQRRVTGMTSFSGGVGAGGEESSASKAAVSVTRARSRWSKLRMSFAMRTYVSRQLNELQVLHGMNEEEYDNAYMGTGAAHPYPAARCSSPAARCPARSLPGVFCSSEIGCC